MDTVGLKRQARALEQQGKIEEALGLYKLVMHEIEGTPLAQQELPLFVKVGDLMMKTGDPAGAIDIYEKAGDEFATLGSAKSVIALAVKVVRADVKRVNIYLRFSRRLLNANHVDAARLVLIDYAQRAKLEKTRQGLERLAGHPEEEVRRVLEHALTTAEQRSPPSAPPPPRVAAEPSAPPEIIRGFEPTPPTGVTPEESETPIPERPWTAPPLPEPPLPGPSPPTAEPPTSAPALFGTLETGPSEPDVFRPPPEGWAPSVTESHTAPPPPPQPPPPAPTPRSDPWARDDEWARRDRAGAEPPRTRRRVSGSVPALPVARRSHRGRLAVALVIVAAGAVAGLIWAQILPNPLAQRPSPTGGSASAAESTGVDGTVPRPGASPVGGTAAPAGTTGARPRIPGAAGRDTGSIRPPNPGLQAPTVRPGTTRAESATARGPLLAIGGLGIRSVTPISVDGRAGFAVVQRLATGEEVTLNEFPVQTADTTTGAPAVMMLPGDTAAGAVRFKGYDVTLRGVVPQDVVLRLLTQLVEVRPPN